jgi:hypothetical protein
MARYLCSSCHEVVESAPTRVAFCASCGTPLTTEDLLPVQPMIGGRPQPDPPVAVPEPSP